MPIGAEEWDLLRDEVELPVTDGVDEAAAKVMRRQIAEGVENWFEQRGCAIHSQNDKSEFQPHIYITATSRSVRQVDGEWVAEAASARGPAAADAGRGKVPR